MEWDRMGWNEASRCYFIANIGTRSAPEECPPILLYSIPRSSSSSCVRAWMCAAVNWNGPHHVEWTPPREGAKSIAFVSTRLVFPPLLCGPAVTRI